MRCSMPQAFGVELERPGIAVGQRWLDLVARKYLTFGHRRGERPDPLQEFPVVGHQEPIICRRMRPTGYGPSDPSWPSAGS